MKEAKGNKVKQLKSKELGTEEIQWDLSVFYDGLDDPQLDRDIQMYTEQCKVFSTSFRGNLDTKLGDALIVYRELRELSAKIFVYLFLRLSVDVNDEEAKTKQDEAEITLSEVEGEYLTFFALEIIDLSEDVLQKQIESSDVVAHHQPYLEDIRKEKPYVLSEEVETIVTQTSPFRSSSWSSFYEEILADLRFHFQDKEMSLIEILNIVSESPHAKVRAEALRVVNGVLQKNFSKLSAQTLNMVVGQKRFFDKKRGYTHPMQTRNIGNKISDEIVRALHSSVEEKAAPLMRRFYKLKGAHLGIKPMSWSDRNAPMPFSDSTKTPYGDALEMVINAYSGFSPTLADIIQDMVSNHRIDAHVTSSRMDGAFSYSMVLPDSKTTSLVFLNYLGSNRDIMTLAHELGHSAHGMLAGRAQGLLMQHTGMVVAETASVFGEMTTFNAIKNKLTKNGNTQALLALIMGKLDDIINTSVRQVSFSFFEQEVHNAGKRLSPKELCEIWMKQTKRLYGEDGDVFSYKDTDSLWSYVGHFHRPFYVYAYSFGELLTHSLYAQQERLGEKFEPLYIDMLSAGDSKSVSELLKPFDLDPSNPAFWDNGIAVSIEALLNEAEQLSREMGVTIPV